MRRLRDVSTETVAYVAAALSGCGDLMSDRAYAKLKELGILPSPSRVVIRILQVANDPNATVDAVTNLVRSDPATAARILKYVNSPFAGIRRQVSSLKTAVTLLGRNAVKCIAMGYSMIGKATTKCRGFDNDAFWLASSARATCCRHIVDKSNRHQADDLFTCGLLCQIGQLAFAAAYPETYAEVLRTVDPGDSAALRETERQVFDLDHNELTAEMMHDWNLPDTFCQSARYQDDPGAATDRMSLEAFEFARIIQLATWTTALLTPHHIEGPVLSRFINGANRYGIKPNRIDHVFESIKKDWHVIGPIFDLRVPGVPTLAERFVETRRS